MVPTTRKQSQYSQGYMTPLCLLYSKCNAFPFSKYLCGFFVHKATNRNTGRRNIYPSPPGVYHSFMDSTNSYGALLHEFKIRERARAQSSGVKITFDFLVLGEKLIGNKNV